MKTTIQIPTPDLAKSKEFYQRLGYEILDDSEQVLVSDGKFILEIDPQRFVRAGVKLYGDDWSEVTTKLAKLTHVSESNDGFIASDPNGVWVYLSKKTLPHSIGTHSVGITGNFAGISIEAVDVEATVAFWTAVGFDKAQGDIEQGWATFSNGSGVDISIMKTGMCPHLFFNPGLTFFNSGNNLENIEKIRAAKIPITEEITVFNNDGVVDNIIINDPGGLGFFIFND